MVRKCLRVSMFKIAKMLTLFTMFICFSFFAFGEESKTGGKWVAGDTFYTLQIPSNSSSNNCILGHGYIRKIQDGMATVTVFGEHGNSEIQEIPISWINQYGQTKEQRDRNAREHGCKP